MKDGTATIIVMDLEWTSWEGARARDWSGPGEEMEIVQIGAVKLADSDGMPELDAFEVLVRPRINPRLDRYFIDLTGITQQRLDREGMDLKEALHRFQRFVGNPSGLIGFGDELWRVHVNCQLYAMRDPFADMECGDARDRLIAAFDDLPQWVNSCDLPRLLGFAAPGTAHQALADSRCVAEALRRLRAIGKF